MKKIIIAAAMLLALLLPNESQAQLVYPIPDTETQQLEGPVKEVRTYHVDTNPLYTSEEYQQYKRRGQNPPSSVNRLFKVDKFNTKGFLTSQTYYINDKEDDRTTYEYDTNGRILREKNYIDGELNTDYTYSYDSRGLPYTARKINSKGAVIFTEKNTINHEGDKTIQVCRHTLTNGSTETTTVTFGPNHKILSMEIWVDDKPMQKMIMDSEGKLVEVAKYQPSFSTIRISHDGKGGEKQSRFSSYGKFEGGVENTLDSHGNVLKSTAIGRDKKPGETIEYKYSYDNHGNWTRRTPSKIEWPDQIEVREISYY